MPLVQLTLIDDPAIARAERFKAFHLANPHVYRMLLRSAREVRRNPRITKWGIKNLWEKLRWDLAVSTEHVGDYRLNNDYPAYYARMMLRDFPEEFDGWLETRGDNCFLPTGV